MFGGLTRTFARLHLRTTQKTPGPLGSGMAVFVGDHIGTKIILDGAFALSELDAVKKFVLPHVPDGSVFFDIGANIGNHARYFAPHFAHTFAFEPHPRTSLLLQANAMGQTITPLTYGLSNQAADLPATTNAANMGGSRITTDAAPSDTTFRVERLDDVAAGLTQSKIGFMKIDVEEHETEMIEGGAKTIAAHQPIIAMEINPPTVKGGTSPAFTALKSLGYTHFYDFQNTASWTRIRGKPPQRITRSLMRLFAPGKVYNMQMVQVEGLSEKGHALLIASVGELG